MVKMKRIVAGMMLSVTMASAQIHPSPGERKAFAAGVAVGVVFRKQIWTGTKAVAKATAKSTKYVGKVVTGRVR